jgi:hypothetical protein
LGRRGRGSRRILFWMGWELIEGLQKALEVTKVLLGCVILDVWDFDAEDWELLDYEGNAESQSYITGWRTTSIKHSMAPRSSNEPHYVISNSTLSGGHYLKPSRTTKLTGSMSNTFSDIEF